MNNQPTDPAAPPPSEELAILTTLKALRDGSFIQELNDILQTAVDTATELGKPAKLTVTLDIIPAGRTVILSDDIKPKVPEATKDSTIFYLGVANKLQRSDPKQTAFPADMGFTGAARAIL